ncbi:ATP-binding protein [Streptomyces atriruber]|uniref:ATP-binding protein n=1 Tax=Streptomyces atriruber TaxID=545121 RepID=UPI0006E209FD|nr:LuxR C-terminal-related transcriptional regulator [Streptomyces atriruber]
MTAEEHGGDSGELLIGNLPKPRVRLIGRQSELLEVQRLCRKDRLVTLTGVAGVGKTRLALEAAAALQRSFLDGAWWVELSPLRTSSVLAHAIAEELPLADQSTRPMIEVLAEYVAGREMLLVLDTCEHLTDACALTARALLDAAPGLHILTTSRRPLRVADERLLTVEPMPVPEHDDPAAAGNDAVVLLAERAAAVVPGFTVTGANQPDVVRLCRRLEGLPLAIELAAARLRELPPAELADHLGDRLAVLGDTEEAVYDAHPPWHQALRTAIGWSNELCTPQERLLWARASVFAGTFDAETVRRVCADELLPAGTIPDLLTALTDASILSWAPTGDGDRYRMLDTIREYGAFWLESAGEGDACRRRHVVHYTSRLRRFADRFLTSEQVPLYWALIPERENLRAALGYALDGDAGDAVALTAVMWSYWTCAGQPREAGHWMDLALERAPEPTADRFTTLTWSCTYATYRGEHAAARRFANQAQEVADQLGDRRLAGQAAMSRGIALAYGGELDTGLDLLCRATEILLEVGDAPSMCWVAFRRGLTRTIAGDLNAGLSDFAEVLELLGENSEESYLTAFTLVSMGIAHVLSGDTAVADKEGRRALELQLTRDDLLGQGASLSLLAWGAAQDGRYPRSACLFGAADAVWALAGAVPFVGNPKLGALHTRFDAAARQVLGDRRYALLHRQGATLPRSAAVKFAVSNRDTALRTASEALTSRELEVAVLVAEGLSNRVIAKRLAIAEHAADTHVDDILAKLGCSDRREITTLMRAEPGAPDAP